MFLFITLFFSFSVCFGEVKSSSVSIVGDSIRKGKIYELSIKSEYLDSIMDGSKTIEIRLDVPKLKSLEKNDLIYFYDEKNRCGLCQVIYSKKYQAFDKLLSMEGIANAIPEIKVNERSGCELIKEGVEMINELSGYKEKIKTYGALAIKLYYLNFCTKRPPQIVWVNDA